MLKEERHRHILDLLQHDGRVLAADLAARLGMSEDTARRDLGERPRPVCCSACMGVRCRDAFDSLYAA